MIVVNIVWGIGGSADFDFVGIDGNGVAVIKGNVEFWNKDLCICGKYTYGRKEVSFEYQLEDDGYWQLEQRYMEKLFKDFVLYGEDVYVNNVIGL